MTNYSINQCFLRCGGEEVDGVNGVKYVVTNLTMGGEHTKQYICLLKN